MKTVKFLAMTAAIAPLAAVAVPAVVQAADAEEVTEVVVTARRPLAESEASALQAQRKSDSLVSVISADAIGNLPDQNIAFAVSRLPGVTVERDQGQARYVNLRGAPNYWTTLSFDGLSVVSPEGRASRFDNIPSAIASQVVVQKAIVPSMPGDTVAGNVEIRTRRAFDYKGQKIVGKLGLGYVELGEGEEKDSSLVYSNIFMGGKLGVVAQASYYSRDMATENWETDPYLVSDAGSVTKRFAQETKNKHYRLTRENYSFSTRVDYKLNDNHEVFFSTINTAFDDTEHRDQFIFQLNQGTTASGVAYGSSAFYATQAATFNPVSDTVYGGRISARITYRNYYDRMSTNTIGGESKFGGGLDMSWRLNYTWTDNTTDVPLELRFQNGSASGSGFLARPTFRYDFTSGSSNIVELYRTTGTTSARTVGARVQNIEDFDMPMSQATRQENREITEAWTAKVDFDKDAILFGRDSKVEFGFLYTDRIKESNVRNEARKLSTTARLANIVQDGPYLGKQRLGYTFRYSNIDAAYALYNGLSIDTPDTRSLADFWKVNETITAGYLMATTKFDWGNLVYGSRVEQIELATSAFSNGKLIKTSREETLFYPSAHLNWNLNDRMKVRVGLSTSASRPDFDETRPNFTINTSEQSISGGNPDATPEKQTGLDTYFEWYAPNHFFSAGVFYKDIQDVLAKTSRPFGRTDLDTPTQSYANFSYVTRRNVGDGYLSGLELYYSGSFEPLFEKMNFPAWTHGFGVRATAMFAKSEVTLPAVDGVPARKISLPGTSDEAYNLQATYEKYGLSVRLAYQFRTASMQEVGDYKLVAGKVVPNGNGDIYWDADEEVDLSVRYQLNKHIELYLDGQNLSNDGAKRYGDTVLYPIEFERFGSRYIAGFRFNY